MGNETATSVTQAQDGSGAQSASPGVPAAHDKKELSVILDLANRHGMEKAHFVQALKATVIPANTSDAQFAAFCMVASQYNLNPLTKEIYAFPAKGGGIQPIVSIDGWCNIINSNPYLDGIEFDDKIVDGKLVSITCKISRKDRKLPVECTEYMSECERPTDPWKKWPARMLRHKALIQCARYAFSLSGIVDQDEAERMDMVDVTPMVTDPKTGEQVKAGPSPFKTAKARKDFCIELEKNLKEAQSEEEIKLIVKRNAPTLNAMKVSESDYDQVSAENMDLQLEMAQARLEAAKPQQDNSGEISEAIKIAGMPEDFVSLQERIDLLKLLDEQGAGKLQKELDDRESYIMAVR